jgi:hypothetical protein
VSNDRAKDPERVRLGRLGALTLHATGKTNTAPARAAYLAGIAAEAGIEPDLSPEERSRRMSVAMRARMIRLNEARWSKSRNASTVADASAEASTSEVRGGTPSTD